MLSADVIDDEKAEKIVTAIQSGKNLRVKWEFHKDGKTHGFVIDSIQRMEKADSVIVKWDGSVIDVDDKGEKVYKIPALGDFTVLETDVVQQPDQYVMIRFSDPIDTKQNLEGLITLEGAGTLTYTVEDNEVHVFPSCLLYTSRCV